MIIAAKILLAPFNANVEPKHVEPHNDRLFSYKDEMACILLFYKSGNRIRRQKDFVRGAVLSEGGKTLGERTRALISIAHPDFREELTFAAKMQGIMI